MAENASDAGELVDQKQLASPDLPRSDYPQWQITLSFWLAWAFVFGGLLGSLYLPFSIWQTRQFVAQAVHAQAPIVEFKTYPPVSGKSHETYRPIVEVTDASGTSARVLVGEANYPNPFRIGSRIAVLFTPGKPDAAVMDTVEDTWGTTIAIAIFFPFMLILGIVGVLWMRFFVKHKPMRLTWLDRWSVPLKILSRLMTGW